MHGDYRLDNMIYAADKPQVVAVLDWELSTLGDPLADFSYLLMQWVMSSGGGRTGLVGSDLPALNIPTLEEAIEIYCEATGRSGIPDLNWYFSYNLFRLTGILQGIAGRIRDGTASSARAAESAARVVPLAKASWEYAVKAGASSLGTQSSSCPAVAVRAPSPCSLSSPDIHVWPSRMTGTAR